MVSNATFWDPLRPIPPTATFFPGTNILVYIRGSDDSQDDWWKQGIAQGSRAKPIDRRGVLVNSHFDS